MKDKILTHLVTIFLNSDKKELNNMMFNEDDYIKNHIPAIKNIERQMNKFRIPYISNESVEYTDILCDHTLYGNIVISNFKSKDPMLFAYLPEIITEEKKNLIVNIIEELEDCEIHLFKQKGEKFYTEHKDEYVKNKQISLTKHLQNDSLNKKD